MNLISLALFLVLLAMLFAIFTQRLLISRNVDIYEPITTKIEDVRISFDGMKQRIAQKIDHYRDVIADDRKEPVNMSTTRNVSPIQETAAKGTPQQEDIVDWIAGLRSSLRKRNQIYVAPPASSVSGELANNSRVVNGVKDPSYGEGVGKSLKLHESKTGIKLSTHGDAISYVFTPNEPPEKNYFRMSNIHLSPREGTDISFHHHLNNLNCPNQSICIVPKLQLIPKLKIYLCKHPVKQGVRFYFITKEGFLLHPNVELLPYEKIKLADYVVYLPGSAPWHRTECNDSMLANKLIVMDEFDGHGHFMPFGNPAEMMRAGYEVHSDNRNEFMWYYMYFKRSYIIRKNGVLRNFPHLLRPDFYPITYSLAEAYIRPAFNFKREMEIVCTLRGSTQQPARKRVQSWVKEYVKERSIEKAIVGQVRNLVLEILCSCSPSFLILISFTYFLK